MLEFKGLTKSFRGKSTPAVNDLDLEVHDGEIVGFVGLNGAGKTTTIRIAAGVTLPSEGSVSVDGKDIVEEKAAASTQIGWVSEFPNFEPNARALDLLRYLAGFYGIRGSRATKRCRHLLSVVGLPDTEHVRFRAFSQGMKKRFGIARALLGDPQNLLLDEVLNGLDPEGVHFVRELVVDLRKQGMAILLSSHILSELQSVADRFAIVHRGKLVKVLSQSDLSNEGGARLRIRVPGLDEKGRDYLATLGKLEERGKTLWLQDPRLRSEQVCSELVHRGYHVAELSIEPESLEEVFLKIIGRPVGASAQEGVAS